MTIHLIKLCVGVESVDDHRDWIDRVVADRVARGRSATSRHTTRMWPKRGDEILAGGSLYWVIRGFVQARQEVRDLIEVTGEDGVRRCSIILDRELVAVRPTPRKAFQGWRYLAAEDAPPDLSQAVGGGDLPEPIRRELLELGAW